MIKWLKIALWCLILAAAIPLAAQNVGIGTTTPAKKLDVQGAGGLKVNSTNNGTGNTDWIAGNFGGTAGNRVVMGILQGNATIGAYDHTLNNWVRLYLAPAGGLNIGSLTGSDTRMAVVNADGDLSVQAIPTIVGGTITNVSAAGTSGNPLSVTNGGTAPVIDMPAADATRNGYVSAADWTIFNDKLTLPALTNGSLLFSNGTAIGQQNTKLFWDNPNGRLGVGTSTPASALAVSGVAGLRASSTNAGSGVADWIAGNFGGTAGNRVVMGLLQGQATLGAHNNALDAWAKLHLAPGSVNVGSLAGTGQRMVIADANGDLSTQAIPAVSPGTVTNVSAATTGGNPLVITNGTSIPVIDIPTASATRNGYVSAADWVTFNSRQNTLSNANALSSGILTNTDWTAFNSKFTLPALTNGSVLFSDGTTIAQSNARLFWNNTNGRLGIGVTNPASTLEVAGSAGLKVSTANPGSGPLDWIAGNFGGTAGDRVVTGNLFGNATIGAHGFSLTNWSKLLLNPGGATAVGSLTGTGTRMVTANADGELGAQPIPVVADNLGSHAASQTVSLNNHWLSNDGTAKGIKMDNNGQTGIGIATPQGALDVPSLVTAPNGTYSRIPNGTTYSDNVRDGQFRNGYSSLRDTRSFAFDGNLATTADYWIANRATWLLAFDPCCTPPPPPPLYVGQQYAQPKIVKQYRVVFVGNVGFNFNITVRLEAANMSPTGLLWVVLDTKNLTGSSIDQAFTINNNTPYLYYRIAVPQTTFDYSGIWAPFINEAAFFEENFSTTPVSGALTVKSDGKTGIGTSGPTANLDVAGAVRWRNGAAASTVLVSDANGHAAWGGLNMNSLKVSTLNNGTGAADWIALNAGGSATGTGSNTHRFVAGNVNGVATIGGHNKDLNAWTNLVINEAGSNTVTVGGSANVTPPVGGTTAGMAQKLIVNGSVQRSYYGVSTGAIPGNSHIVITWNHGLGYNPIVIASLDQTGGGSYMDFCKVVTRSINAQEIEFIIRNLGSNTAIGSLRWILVW